MKFNSNTIASGKYVFVPKRYDKNNNLICVLYRAGAHGFKCKLTGRYDFINEKFMIDYVSNVWLNSKHKKLVNWFLSKYDWEHAF